jgi:imidazolonepropionase-like amidohydrolase
MAAGLLTVGAITLPSSTAIFAQAPAPAPASPANAVTVIQNATILTVTHGTIEKGSILIRNGKIAEVGRNVSVPGGATVIDAAGKYVMPGIIDCHSHIGVDGGVNVG